MSLLVRSHTPPPGDELDGLLRAYFQAELPDPFPSLEAPAPRAVSLSPRPAPSRWNLFRSRLALAASVALLIAGPLFIPAGAERPRDPSALDGQPSPGSAHSRELPGLPGALPPDVKIEETIDYDPATGQTYHKLIVKPADGAIK
jgi:hypothetical protein